MTRKSSVGIRSIQADIRIREGGKTLGLYTKKKARKGHPRRRGTWGTRVNDGRRGVGPWKTGLPKKVKCTPGKGNSDEGHPAVKTSRTRGGSRGSMFKGGRLNHCAAYQRGRAEGEDLDRSTSIEGGGKHGQKISV